ncbi:MAG: hypothetical protein L3J05_06900 [Robiginitomaculum sp.]|nr:hypothetical protein [Robiginitomaculum sp.]
MWLLTFLDMDGGEVGLHLGDETHIAIIISKCANMHRRNARKMPQDMVRTDFVTAICGPGNTVREEKNFTH